MPLLFLYPAISGLRTDNSWKFIREIAILQYVIYKGIMPKITILYDNYAFREGTIADWGFSCLVEGMDKTILFDTGANPDILEKNIAALDVDITVIDVIVISHDHWDHTGGIPVVTFKNPGLRVYLPGSPPRGLVDPIRDSGAEPILVTEPLQILANVWLTGEMGDAIREQSMIIDTIEGTVVITGCAHPGITEILERTVEMAKPDISRVIGGFHLMNHSKEEVMNIIDAFRRLGVRNVSPSHCTGDMAISMFEEYFGDNYIKIGTGKTIEL